MPQALSNKPIRHGWMDLYLKAFEVLSKKRLSLYSPQPIQYSELCYYADRNNVDDLELFESILSKLDRLFIDRVAEKAKTERQKERPKRGRK